MPPKSKKKKLGRGLEDGELNSPQVMDASETPNLDNSQNSNVKGRNSNVAKRKNAPSGSADGQEKEGFFKKEI